MRAGLSHAEAVELLHQRTAIYTAPPVVSIMFDKIDWPNAGGRLLDPSAGDGQFLAEALRRLLPHIKGRRADAILTRIAGWEIHPEACRQARWRLAEILVQHGFGAAATVDIAVQLVKCGDFLTQHDPAQLYDFIVGNPPYLRYANVPEPLRSEYDLKLPRHARADMLHSFLQACADSLADTGQIAFITADRWLINMGARTLRAELGGKLAIDGITRLDPLSSFYRPKVRRAGTPPRVHPISFVLKPHRHGGTPLNRQPLYPDAIAWTAPPSAVTLGSVANVRLAPWLGTSGIFVVDKKAAAALPEILPRSGRRHR